MILIRCRAHTRYEGLFSIGVLDLTVNSGRVVGVMSNVRKKGLSRSFGFGEHFVDPSKRCISNNRSGVAVATVVSAVGTFWCVEEESGVLPIHTHALASIIQ